MQHKWQPIDETERREWQNPESILKHAGLKAGMTFMDIGCGNGFFTLPAARMVGEKGRVYAVDIDEEALAEIRTQASSAGLNNITLETAKAEDTVFCLACADRVFFGIVLHDFQDPAKVLQNARQMLKSGGELVNLDWKKTRMPYGPPLAKRFSENMAARLIEAAGFSIDSVRDSGQYNYIVTARAKPNAR